MSLTTPLNPLLQKIKLPGRVFQLPSKGAFYPPGVLAANVRDGEIQIKPMSALTELKLRSADLLVSGKIIEEVCSECAPEILQPSALVSQDVDSLFLFLYMSTYGQMKTVKAVHDGCKKSPKKGDNALHEYQVSLDPIVTNPRNDCLKHKEMLYQVTIKTGQTVLLKPVNFDESLRLINMRQELRKRELMDLPIEHRDTEGLLIADLMSVIAAVETDGDTERIRVTDRKQIEEWLRALPRVETEAIVNAANAAGDWGFKFETTLKCKDCSESFDYNLELNPVNFFSG